MVHEFRNDEEGYLNWIEETPDGFVDNTRKNIPSSYLVLHSASCSSIKKYRGKGKPGGFTERQFIKICSKNISDLLK